MTFSSLLRAVGAGRRTAQPEPGTAPGGPSASVRHPAMNGLNVSPVHGRHCICDRCAPDERERLPLAG